MKWVMESTRQLPYRWRLVRERRAISVCTKSDLSHFLKGRMKLARKEGPGGQSTISTGTYKGEALLPQYYEVLTVTINGSLGALMKLKRFINLYNGDAIFNSEDAGEEDPLPPDDGPLALEVSIALQLSWGDPETYQPFQLTR